MFLPRSSNTRRRRRERLVPVAAAAGVILLVLIVHEVAPDRASRHKRPPGAVPRLAPIRQSTARQRMEAAQRRAIDRVLAYSPYISRGSARRREVALTFDDGPGPATRQVLKLLHRYKVHATFFQVGQMVRAFPGLARDEVAQGHAVGTHTNSHARLRGMPLGFQKAQTDPRNEMVAGYAPNFTRLFRPPYGMYDPRTVALMKQRRTLMVLWSVSTFDYTQPGVKAIVKRAVKGAFPGAIILMHDAGGFSRAETVRALPAVIRGLRHRRFKLVTVPRMVLDDPPPRNQPRARGPG